MRIRQESRRGRKRKKKHKRKSEVGVLHFKANLQFDTLLFQWVTTWYGRDSTTARSKKWRKAIHPALALSFLTPTLMFPLLPMATLKHTIFHIEPCFRNVWRALHHGERAIVERHNADLKAAVFSQQGHFYTAWLQWVCAASGGETENLNRRSSPLLIPHACTKKPQTTLLMLFCVSGMKTVLSGWQCKPRPFVPKALLHGGKRQLLRGASAKAVKSRGTWVSPPSAQRTSLMTGPHASDTRRFTCGVKNNKKKRKKHQEVWKLRPRKLLESGFLPDICLSGAGYV